VARTGEDGDAVALVGHLDTVPNWEGGTATVEGDRIVGRGAADMKGGVAVMVRLLERLAREPRPVVHVFYDREEGPHLENGIHRVIAESRLLGRPGLAVVLEPTAGTIHAGAVGTLNAEVVYRGAAAMPHGRGRVGTPSPRAGRRSCVSARASDARSRSTA
jgi:succinyl-diaminopimelate desuccinylase